MIRTIDRYLTMLFLGRFVLLLFALGALVTMLDFLANGDQVMRATDGSTAEVLRYTWLRLPDILYKVFPITVLLTALVTLTTLVSHGELTALRAAGVSQWRVMLALSPAAVLIAVGQFLLQDQVLPPSVAELRAWGIGEYQAERKDGMQPATWLRRGTDIVRIAKLDQEAARAEGVVIFHRDMEGNLVHITEAERAELGQDIWLLQEVARTAAGETEPTFSALESWQSGIALSDLAWLTVHPRELSFAEVMRFVDRGGYGNRPQHVYLLWLYKKIATPLASIVIILLAVPLVQRFDRTGGGVLILAGGLALGFVYLTMDELLLAIGEAGLMPPALSATAATMALLAISGAVALHHEIIRRPSR